MHPQTCGSRPQSTRPRALPALVLAILATCVGGCLTADGTLENDGTGTLMVSYQASPGVDEASQRALLTAPGVSVESLAVAADRTVSAKLKVTDLAGIGKTTLLKMATVTKTAEGDAQVLTIKITNAEKKSGVDSRLPGPKIRVTLPGPVIEANENATVDGTHVQWNPTLTDFLSRTSWELKARYRPAASEDKKAGAPAADAKAAAPTDATKPDAAKPAAKSK